MRTWAKPVKYTDHAGETDYYCSFPNLASYILGYWTFLGRDVYEGWEEYIDDPINFIKFIGEIYCPSNNQYADNVIKLQSESEKLLFDMPMNEITDNENENHTAITSSKYSVKFYKGDYKNRQEQANRDNCIAYVEHHFNCCLKSNGYTVTVTAYNASQTSKNWGRWYAKAISQEFGTRIGGSDGIVVGGFNGRGNGNIYYTKMPAILLEPLFASDEKQAKIIRSEEGRTRLAKILVESIYNFFPEGGLIAFSVGHKYKESNPNDRGTKVFGGGNEADYAEMVLEKAKEIIENNQNEHINA